jgi:hypothetical protein
MQANSFRGRTIVKMFVGKLSWSMIAMNVAYRQSPCLCDLGQGAFDCWAAATSGQNGLLERWVQVDDGDEGPSITREEWTGIEGCGG